VLFVSIGKVYRGVLYVEHHKIRRWEKSRPKFNTEETNIDIMIDQLILDDVSGLDGGKEKGRIPLRDTEVVQNDPFTHQMAEIETSMGGNSVKAGMEYG
jgi:hypothetical protein